MSGTLQELVSSLLSEILLVGHYLNLPVVEADGRLVAIVDVLKLTYATLEQVWSSLMYDLFFP